MPPPSVFRCVKWQIQIVIKRVDKGHDEMAPLFRRAPVDHLVDLKQATAVGNQFAIKSQLSVAGAVVIEVGDIVARQFTPQSQVFADEILLSRRESPRSTNGLLQEQVERSRGYFACGVFG